MKPVTVSVTVTTDRERVYELLAVTAAHEAFTDHMLTEWHCSGPARGVGSKANVTAVLGGRREPVEITVIADEPPHRIVEENIGAGGRRRATGTYELDARPEGGTVVRFTYAWQQAPLAERVMAPVVRAMMRRALRRSMQRLAEQLAARDGAAADVA